MVAFSAKLDTLDFAPIGIWKLDLSLNIVEANRAAGNQIGLACEALIGKNILELVPSLPKEMFLQTLEKGQSVSRQQICVSNSGRKEQGHSYWETWLGQIKSNSDQVSGLVLSTVEVTEREILKQQREDFIAAIAHNLKSPLVGADMILDSLMRLAQGPLNSAQMECLTLLKKSNLDLLDMVQELIEVYRYETKSAYLHFVPINLFELVHSCAQPFKDIASANQVEIVLKVKSPICLAGDRQALKKLFNNLLENALRFTPAGGSVTIEASCSRNGQVKIRITDTGCGIDLADPDVLFQRFWQGEGGNNYAAVTGLGLYLCRQIVDAHSGRIELTSRPSKGTRISITLPEKLCQAEAESP